MIDVALCACPEKPTNTEQESGNQPKLVSSPSAPLSSPGLQQIPKEKETQDQTICTQLVFARGDADAHLRASSTGRNALPNRG